MPPPYEPVNLYPVSVIAEPSKVTVVGYVFDPNATTNRTLSAPEPQSMSRVCVLAPTAVLPDVTYAIAIILFYHENIVSSTATLRYSA
jgi:hypothetical protein